MALNLVPGVNEVTIPITTGISAARGAVGEEKYQTGRSAVTWTYGALNGFLPVPPMIMLAPVKIALFIIILIICIFVFSMGWWSLLAAYLGQAIIIMLMTNWFMDKFFSFGLGV